MTRDELLKTLRDLKPWMETQGLVNVRLFGSYARDEAGPTSDIDLLVDETRTLSVLDRFDVEEALGARLKRTVDVCFERNLNPYVRQTALRDALVV